jgi:hypothetical protein
VSFRIDRVWLFVAQSPGEDEGVIAVAADETRLEGLRARTKELRLPPGTTIKVVRFETRVEMETLP